MKLPDRGWWITPCYTFFNLRHCTNLFSFLGSTDLDFDLIFVIKYYVDIYKGNSQLINLFLFWLPMGCSILKWYLWKWCFHFSSSQNNFWPDWSNTRHKLITLQRYHPEHMPFYYIKNCYVPLTTLDRKQLLTQFLSIILMKKFFGALGWLKKSEIDIT